MGEPRFLLDWRPGRQACFSILLCIVRGAVLTSSRALCLCVTSKRQSALTQLCCFECEMHPTGSHTRSLGPRLVALFGEAVGRVGGKALLEEAHHPGWRGRLWGFLAPPYFQLTLLRD